MFVKIFILSVSVSLLSLASSSSLPGWENLQCERGHKYLFSDVSHTWQDARDECELYGGWLLSINSQQEQNCLVRFAHSSGLHTGWFWHDGNFCIFLLFMLFIPIFLKANDVADEGVLVHAKDNSDLIWINDRIGCNVDHWDRGYDYYVLGLFGESDRRTGAWCDVPDVDYYFICEGPI